jgi:predicted ATP-binding protein involved in virulence
MNITRLKLTNLRAIRAAEFKFQPGFNLIVGVNGVGKTSVLDALAVCLSAITRQVNHIRTSVEGFVADDIRVGGDALTIECGFTYGGDAYTYLIHKPRASSVPQQKKTGQPREQVHDTPERTEYIGATPKPLDGNIREDRPLAVLFSTRRAVSTDRSPSKGVSAGGIAAAFGDAFANRELRLGEFAAWMHVQEVLKADNPTSRRVLKAFEETVRRFLPDYKNLRAEGHKKPTLMINRGNTPLEVRQLSDGERGTLAMVLDLTRRIAQANPGLADPTANAEAVVLIDEIDLHLHPQWQRRVVQNLTAAFPKCQFIATTHSPQVIGEVDHQRIQIMGGGEVYTPTHSFGVDSSRVLEEIMDTAPRSERVQRILPEIAATIDAKKYKIARKLLAELKAEVGDNDPEVTRIETLLEFMEEDK